MPDIIQISTNTWRFEDDFVRFFLLEGAERAALIDSGVASANALELAKTLTDKPVVLINTHGDGDHTSGTAAFAEIHMHEQDYVNCGIGAKFPGVKLAKINDGDIIDLGGRPLKAVHIPGHTRGSLAFLDVNSRILFAGDSVQKGHIFMFGGHRCPEAFEAALDKIIALQSEYDCIYASHGEFCLPKDYAEKVKAAWLTVRAGNLAFEMVNLYGAEVKSYTLDACGFYLD